MPEFRSHCPCSLCRKVRAKQQPVGHTGVDYARPAPPPDWKHDIDGYIRPANHATRAAVWNRWENETPIFHNTVLAHNEALWKTKPKW